jgi:hypothetical protein
MKVDYFKLFWRKANKDKDKIDPPEAHSIIEEDTRISAGDMEEQRLGTTSAKPNKRKQYRVAAPHCTECGWSKS